MRLVRKREENELPPEKVSFMFVDLDGCLADDTHRRMYLPEHAVKTPHQKFDFDVDRSWDEYFSRAYDDSVNEKALDFLQDWVNQGIEKEVGGISYHLYMWVILTGRPTTILDITYKWTNEKVKTKMSKRVAGLHFHTLCRAQGDYRQALEVKQELIDNLLESVRPDTDPHHLNYDVQEVHIMDNDLNVLNGLEGDIIKHHICLDADK